MSLLTENRSEAGRHTPMNQILGTLGPVVSMVILGGADRDLGPDAWRSDKAALCEAGLAGAALGIARSNHLDVPADVRSELQELTFDRSLSSAIVIQQAVTALRALREAGLPFLVFKGPSYALAGFDVISRPFSDLDILVRPSDFVAAMKVLSGLGYAEELRNQQPRRYFDRFCREAVNLRNSDGGSIDLHHHIPPWQIARRLTFDVLQRDAVTATIGDEPVRYPSAEHLLAITLLHLLSDKNAPGHSVRIWRDIAGVVACVNLHRAADVLGAARLNSTSRWILGCLATPDSLALAQILDDTSRQHARLPLRVRLLTHPSVASRKLLGQIVRLPTPGALLYAIGFAVPSRAFLVRKTGRPFGYLQWWRSNPASLDDRYEAKERSA